VGPTQPSREVAAAVAPMPQESVPPGNARTHSAGELVVLPEPAPLQNPEPLSPSEEVPDGRMEARAAAQDAAQLPSWYELPQEFRNQLDVPHPDLHVYSEEPQNRFILVNLKKYREGETLDSGLVLEEILPDGMVMSYRGERFTVEK
jgi:general secretion pathway protein B